MAKVLAVCISEKKGVQKKAVPYIDVRCHHGIVGDAHAGDWHRQISLLAKESVDQMRGCGVNLFDGAFAETPRRNPRAVCCIFSVFSCIFSIFCIDLKRHRW